MQNRDKNASSNREKANPISHLIKFINYDIYGIAFLQIQLYYCKTRRKATQFQGFIALGGRQHIGSIGQHFGSGNPSMELGFGFGYGYPNKLLVPCALPIPCVFSARVLTITASNTTNFNTIFKESSIITSLDFQRTAKRV